jgi:hypothetical protein
MMCLQQHDQWSQSLCRFVYAGDAKTDPRWIWMKPPQGETTIVLMTGPTTRGFVGALGKYIRLALARACIDLMSGQMLSDMSKLAWTIQTVCLWPGEGAADVYTGG